MIYISWDIEHNILKLVILGHFLPFYHLKVKILKNEKICWIYHHFPHVYQKSQSYDARFLRYGVRQTEFFVILGHLFVTLPPRHPLKNQNFEKKWKKCLEILSFYTSMCTINEDHVIYRSWNIRCDRQKFLSFWAIFYLFSPLTTRKIKILLFYTFLP